MEPVYTAYLRMLAESAQVNIANQDVDDVIVAYHGTNAHAYTGGKIERFHTNSARGAAFFSSNKDIARQYGEKVYKVGIKLLNPLIVHSNGQYWANISPATKVLGHIPDKLRTVSTKRASELNSIFKELGIHDGVDQKSHFDGYDSLHPHHELSHLTDASSTDDIARSAKRFDYDGVIFHGIHDEPIHDKHLYHPTQSDVYAVFDSSKIKIVD